MCACSFAAVPHNVLISQAALRATLTFEKLLIHGGGEAAACWPAGIGSSFLRGALSVKWKRRHNAELTAASRLVLIGKPDEKCPPSLALACAHAARTGEVFNLAANGHAEPLCHQRRDSRTREARVVPDLQRVLFIMTEEEEEEEDFIYKDKLQIVHIFHADNHG